MSHILPRRRSHRPTWQSVFGFANLLVWGEIVFAQQFSHNQAVEAMHKSVSFFQEHASSGGGYVFRVSADLKLREGENKVGDTTAWIQPPGTPAVGLAYLNAWKLTKDPLPKAAAISTAEALLRGQLQSGGWDNLIEFAPEDRQRYAYRIDGGTGSRLRNDTTFDDDKSQSCIRFLMQLDQALDFQDARIHEATMYALDCVLKAQYPNGAWPQRFSEFPKAEEFPVRAANFPETWPREFPGENYSGYYTLNDNTISDVMTTLLDAWDIYREERFLAAAKRGGEFFLLAQLPEPQPGWAQQYNRQMQPAWARKFEPPAITGGESQGVMRTLLLLYRRTGDDRFLKPISRALVYYNTLVLPNGRLARFYEIGTDRPLFFTKKYELVYTDDDLPTHYEFMPSNGLKRLAEEHAKLLTTPQDKLWTPSAVKRPKMSDDLEHRAREVALDLDRRGAWVEPGRMRTHGTDDSTREVIDSRTFLKNLTVLAEFVAASRP